MINLAKCAGRVIVLIVCVCVSVFYRSSGRYGFSISGTKVPTENPRRGEYNKCRILAENV